jgi:hypothetical protein
MAPNQAVLRCTAKPPRHYFGCSVGRATNSTSRHHAPYWASDAPTERRLGSKGKQRAISSAPPGVWGEKRPRPEKTSTPDAISVQSACAFALVEATAM